MSVATRQKHWEDQREYWTSKAAEYQQKLEHAKRKRDEAIVALSPFSVGEEVEYCKAGEWEPAIVRGIEPHSWGNYFRISLRKKNGEWSNSVRSTYSDRTLRKQAS